MNKRYFNNFVDKHRLYHQEVANKMTTDIKERCLGKLVGIYIDIKTDPWHAKEILKIIRLKDVSCRFDDYATNCIFTDVDNNEYRVNRHLIFYDIEEILKDLNEKKPEVIFKINETVEYDFIETKRKMQIRKFLKIFGIKLKVNTFVKEVEKQIFVKLKEITYIKSPMNMEDNLLVIDNNNVHYMLKTPEISVVYRSEIDPFGEEEWDD